MACAAADKSIAAQLRANRGRPRPQPFALADWYPPPTRLLIVRVP
jgi:hypothetical protein